MYHVQPDRPHEHQVGFRGEISGLTGVPFELVLPSWVPGSYHILDYARDVGEVRATGPDGQPRRVERTEKARWRVDPAGAASVELRYSVYGHALMTEGLDLSDEHLFLNAAVCLPYVDGRRDEPYEVVLHLPPEWKVYTELAEVGSSPVRLRASDYDELVDSPIDCGRPLVLEFPVLGVPHRVVICGRGGDPESHRLEEDIRKFVEAGARLFGGLPYRRYTFFVHLSDVPDGALEHATSNSAVIRQVAFREPKLYRRLRWVLCHEWVHLFNVKGIRPAALRPFDYTKEVYTRLLWEMEGTTDYYSLLLLRRSGILPPGKYLDAVAEDAKMLLSTPGRAKRSLEEASRLAWVDLYVRGEDYVNRSISYYTKGHLVSLCLDLEIRHRTENRRSLDDFLQALWQGYGKPAKGVGEEEMLPIANAATGLDLTDFFAKYIAGTDELDLAAFAGHAGLGFGPKPRPPEQDDPEPGWLGVDYEDRGGLVRLTNVRDGSPARRAGLDPGDEIVAFDGVKVTHREFTNALLRHPAGASVRVTLFRRGVLTEVPVTFGAAPPEMYAFTPVAEPSELAKKVYEGWLGAPWEPAKKPSA